MARAVAAAAAASRLLFTFFTTVLIMQTIWRSGIRIMCFRLLGV